MREDKSLEAINELIPIEERPVLDNYIDLLIKGERDAFRVLQETAKIQPTALAQFLAQEDRKQYVEQKLSYFLHCADIDRFKVLQETRDIAYANPRELFEEKEGVVDQRTGETLMNHTIGLKRFDEIPKECWRVIQSIKYDKFGQPMVTFHPKIPALNLLAKLQNLTAQFRIPGQEKRPKGLFHTMQDAKADTETSTPEDPKTAVIDAEFTENLAKEHQKIMHSHTTIKNAPSPSRSAEEAAEKERFSPENMYNAAEEF